MLLDSAASKAAAEHWRVAIIQETVFSPQPAPVTVHLHDLLREQTVIHLLETRVQLRQNWYAPAVARLPGPLRFIFSDNLAENLETPRYLALPDYKGREEAECVSPRVCEDDPLLLGREQL